MKNTSEKMCKYPSLEFYFKKTKYLLKNWKLIIHLLFSTNRFGVNNSWWSSFDSMFGLPWYKVTPMQIIRNYEGMKFRIKACYFVTSETMYLLFPKWYKNKFNGKDY